MGLLNERSVNHLNIARMDRKIHITAEVNKMTEVTLFKEREIKLICGKSL